MPGCAPGGKAETMISPAAAFERLRRIKRFAGMRQSDFRPIVYAQIFSGIASGATSSATPQSMPGGAIILGITASAVVPSAAAASGQSSNNRQLFGLNFSYTNNEALTVGGPVLAEALLGNGQDTVFPVRELIVSPNSHIVCTVVNYTTTTMNIHVGYHCLVYRVLS
jgi:hypothetical protein